MALVLAALSAGLVSCSGNGAVDGPVLTSPRPPLFGGSGMDAGVGGTVVFDESAGCLFLGFASARIPVVWPHGASWQADPPAVELKGQLIEPGMTVRGAGGYLKYALVEDSAGKTVADAAQACVGPTGEIAFFNIGSDVNVSPD